MELHPLKEQQEIARQFRQIGLGIMGLSDMFIKMGIEYGSADSLHVSECLGKLIQRESITQSVLLADKYGTYPQFDLETLVQSHYFKSLDEDIQDLIIGTGSGDVVSRQIIMETIIRMSTLDYKIGSDS